MSSVSLRYNILFPSVLLFFIQARMPLVLKKFTLLPAHSRKLIYPHLLLKDEGFECPSEPLVL